jgi:hypothetical protein
MLAEAGRACHLADDRKAPASRPPFGVPSGRATHPKALAIGLKVQFALSAPEMVKRQLSASTNRPRILGCDRALA